MSDRRPAHVAEVMPRKPFPESWGYLSSPSSRSRKIVEIVRPLLRDGDSVLDAYCGVTPVAPLLRCGPVFGFDGDPDCVNELRARYPEQTWRLIDERSLPFARTLPGKVDVLLGLGLARGYA